MLARALGPMTNDGGVIRIHRPDEVSAKQTERIQPVLDAYTYRVVQRLVGPMGLNKEEVVRTMLRDWIREHKAQLDDMGIQPPKVRDHGIILNHEEAAS